jgi:CubicO group peptidase (beta-lactamase class C family)
MLPISRREFGGLALVLGAAAARADGSTNGDGKLDETLRAGIAKRGIPAVVGMAANKDKILYAGAFGTRDSSGTPVSTDSIFAIASMTKAVTTVAALQLVEQGKVKLEEPVSKYLPRLAKLEVLEGFDGETRKAKLRPARIQVTLKHLLTHTSGFCYDNWDANMFRYTSQKDVAAAQAPPLMFEPGTRWQYGPSIDWTGRLVEAVSDMNLEEYFQAKILRPLDMRDTSFMVPAEKFDRLVGRYHRQADGSLREDVRTPPTPHINGGGGLFSTVGDYVRFMQMILGEGRGVNQAQILQATTVRTMEINQIGDLTAGKMKSYRPDVSSDVDIQPGFTEKWGFGFLINTTAYAGGRSAGSLAWAGINNTFYWIDPKRSICAVLMMQFLPFVDKEAVGLLGDFERAVYGSIGLGA